MRLCKAVMRYRGASKMGESSVGENVANEPRKGEELGRNLEELGS